MINISAIFDWAGTKPKKRNFVEGERLLKAGHIIKGGVRVFRRKKPHFYEFFSEIRMK